jgi:hypothetical protein
MKASELRIGNYILFSEDNTIFEVGSIEEKGYTVQNEEETTWIEAYQFEPITLTKKWLLKFGFEINRQTKENNNIWRCNCTQGNFDIEQIIGFFLWDNNSYSPKIEYIHQLQNLYFALTGEELTIKD